jgi:hypothetical protein
MNFFISSFSQVGYYFALMSSWPWLSGFTRRASAIRCNYSLARFQDPQGYGGKNIGSTYTYDDILYDQSHSFAYFKTVRNSDYLEGVDLCHLGVGWLVEITQNNLDRPSFVTV